MGHKASKIALKSKDITRLSEATKCELLREILSMRLKFSVCWL